MNLLFIGRILLAVGFVRVLPCFGNQFLRLGIELLLCIELDIVEFLLEIELRLSHLLHLFGCFLVGIRKTLNLVKKFVDLLSLFLCCFLHGGSDSLFVLGILVLQDFFGNLCSLAFHPLSHLGLEEFIESDVHSAMRALHCFNCFHVSTSIAFAVFSFK